MSKQQDRLDQMNLLSERFLHGSASLNVILDERLREVMYVAALEKRVFVVFDLPTTKQTGAFTWATKLCRCLCIKTGGHVC